MLRFACLKACSQQMAHNAAGPTSVLTSPLHAIYCLPLQWSPPNQGNKKWQTPKKQKPTHPPATMGPSSGGARAPAAAPSSAPPTAPPARRPAPPRAASRALRLKPRRWQPPTANPKLFVFGVRDNGPTGSARFLALHCVWLGGWGGWSGRGGGVGGGNFNPAVLVCMLTGVGS